MYIFITSSQGRALPYIWDGKVRKFRASQFKASAMTYGYIFYTVWYGSGVLIRVLKFIDRNKSKNVFPSDDFDRMVDDL